MKNRSILVHRRVIAMRSKISIIQAENDSDSFDVIFEFICNPKIAFSEQRNLILMIQISYLKTCMLLLVCREKFLVFLQL